MSTLANKLMGQKTISQPQSVSAIFGQLSGQVMLLSESSVQFRVGMWPIQSGSNPEVAMGLACLLAYHLERWSSIRVYRLLAQIDNDTQDFTWSIEKSQFGVDDWELDGLDENSAIWGEYSQKGDTVFLTLEVENDFADETAETYKKTWEAGNLSRLIALLPQIASSVAESLGAGAPNPMLPTHDATNSWDTSALEAVVRNIFEWERNIYYAFAGKSWSSQESIADFQELFSIGTQLPHGLGAWIVSNAAARLLSRFYQPTFDFFPEYIIKIDGELTSEPEYQVTIAIALLRLGEPISAYYILEHAVEDNPQDTSVWLALAEVYWLDGEQGVALNTYQNAIESGVTSALLYSRYADLLMAFDANNVAINPGSQRTSASGRAFTEQFILIDLDNAADDGLLREATAAYFEAINLEPKNVELRSHLVLNLLDLEDERLWTEFKQLVEIDASGNAVRSVIEGVYALDDLAEGISILSDAAAKHPDRIDIHLNLAMICLQTDENDTAVSELKTARKLANGDKLAEAEVDRLMLMAEDPDFEHQFGEIADMVNAGNELSQEDMDFLEHVMERAPSFVDPYILLANAYLYFDEVPDALDVLLDGQKVLPDNPQLAANLAKVLWRAGENELAFECLNKALVKNKNYVPLLALTGQFLFEDGQDAEARDFLNRAESLDSQDPVLREVRVAIARSMDFDR